MGRVISTRETEIVAPAMPPLRIEFVKTHLKSISSAEDVLIESWIEAAGLYFREMTGRELIETTREYWLDTFPSGLCPIELPRPPLRSVESVQYLSSGSYIDLTDGGSPAVNLYEVAAPSGPYARPGYIFMSGSSAWPTVTCSPGAVRIRYIAGYGATPEDIPELIKTALCGLVGSFDLFRSETHDERIIGRLPFGLDLMIDGFKSSALRTTVPQSGVLWP